MTLTKDDWYKLLVSIILVAILPGWVVLLLPLTPVLLILVAVRLFTGK